MNAFGRAKNKEQRIKSGKAVGFLVAGVAIILVMIPFHAFLTVWAASISGHYTEWRLWKEFLLLPLVAGAGWLVLSDKLLRREAGKSWLLRLMFAYIVLQFVLGAVALGRHEVNHAALAEGLIEDTRLMVFFLVAWVAAARLAWLRGHWLQLLLVPATIVVAFGLLQAFLLPTNFLTHFGYGTTTIPAYELVDLNKSFVRVQSTLRGANPLGAYLVILIAAVAGVSVQRLGARKRQSKQRAVIPSSTGDPINKEFFFDWIPAFAGMTFFALGVASLVVLYFTYSRSAYIGAALAIFGIGWLSITSRRLKNYLLVTAVALCVLVGGTAVLLRHNTKFEDTFFHTSQLSHSAHSSNQNRTSALENGVHDVVHEPLGRGPGTAGPASEHNNHPPRIAENYFLQIGQEVGWLGLALFLAINMLVAKALWDRRDGPDRLPLVLFASFLGLAVINMLSHAWADDTLAYVWWGLAGIALTKN